jgi:hypothetical protein
MQALYFALGVLTIVGIGAIALQPDGITFADGTKQSTAYAPGPTFAFLGTTTAISGNAGVIAMTKRCQVQFGAGARMCTSLEVANTNDFSSLAWTTGYGWVRPLLIVDGAVHYDAVSGIVGNATLTCNGWRSGVDGGLAVQANGVSDEGGFLRALCANVDTGVACCEPLD